MFRKHLPGLAPPPAALVLALLVAAAAPRAVRARAAQALDPSDLVCAVPAVVQQGSQVRHMRAGPLPPSSRPWATRAPWAIGGA